MSSVRKVKELPEEPKATVRTEAAAFGFFMSLRATPLSLIFCPRRREKGDDDDDDGGGGDDDGDGEERVTRHHING